MNQFNKRKYAFCLFAMIFIIGLCNINADELKEKKIVSINCYNEKQDVFNIKVQDYMDYFASGFLVHNTKLSPGEGYLRDIGVFETVDSRGKPVKIFWREPNIAGMGGGPVIEYKSIERDGSEGTREAVYNGMYYKGRTGLEDPSYAAGKFLSPDGQFIWVYDSHATGPDKILGWESYVAKVEGIEELYPDGVPKGSLLMMRAIFRGPVMKTGERRILTADFLLKRELVTGKRELVLSTFDAYGPVYVYKNMFGEYYVRHVSENGEIIDGTYLNEYSKNSFTGKLLGVDKNGKRSMFIFYPHVDTQTGKFGTHSRVIEITPDMIIDETDETVTIKYKTRYENRDNEDIVQFTIFPEITPTTSKPAISPNADSLQTGYIRDIRYFEGVDLNGERVVIFFRTSKDPKPEIADSEDEEGVLIERTAFKYPVGKEERAVVLEGVDDTSPGVLIEYTSNGERKTLHLISLYQSSGNLDDPSYNAGKFLSSDRKYIFIFNGNKMQNEIRGERSHVDEVISVEETDSEIIVKHKNPRGGIDTSKLKKPEPKTGQCLPLLKIECAEPKTSPKPTVTKPIISEPTSQEPIVGEKIEAKLAERAKQVLRQYLGSQGKIKDIRDIAVIFVGSPFDVFFINPDTWELMHYNAGETDASPLLEEDNSWKKAWQDYFGSKIKEGQLIRDSDGNLWRIVKSGKMKNKYGAEPAKQVKVGTAG